MHEETTAKTTIITTRPTVLTVGMRQNVFEAPLRSSTATFTAPAWLAYTVKTNKKNQHKHQHQQLTIDRTAWLVLLREQQKATAKASPTSATYHRPHCLTRIYCENKQKATAKASTTPATYHRLHCLTRIYCENNKKQQQKHHQHHQLTIDRTAWFAYTVRTNKMQQQKRQQHQHLTIDRTAWLVLLREQTKSDSKSITNNNLH